MSEVPVYILTLQISDFGFDFFFKITLWGGGSDLIYRGLVRMVGVAQRQAPPPFAARVRLCFSVGPSILLGRSIFSTNLYQVVFYNDLYSTAVYDFLLGP